MSDSAGSVRQTPAFLVRRFVRQAGQVLLRGFAVIVPFIVMLFLFDMALGFVQGALRPVIKVLE